MRKYQYENVLNYLKDAVSILEEVGAHRDAKTVGDILNKFTDRGWKPEELYLPVEVPEEVKKK